MTFRKNKVPEKKNAYNKLSMRGNIVNVNTQFWYSNLKHYQIWIYDLHFCETQIWQKLNNIETKAWTCETQFRWIVSSFNLYSKHYRPTIIQGSCVNKIWWLGKKKKWKLMEIRHWGRLRWRAIQKRGELFIGQFRIRLSPFLSWFGKIWISTIPSSVYTLASSFSNFGLAIQWK